MENKMKKTSFKKILYLGYLYAATGSLVGTVAFILLNSIIYFCKNHNWSTAFLRYFSFPGIIVSLIPAGIGGIILANKLWRDSQKGIVHTKKSAYRKGGLWGVISILFVLLVIAISPLSSIIERMSFGVAVQYFLLSLFLSYILGGLVGKKLNNILIT